jgi:ADP-ribose pyrophosphatase
MSTRWEKLGSRRVAEFRIFHMDEERYRSPRNAHEVNAVVLHPPDWVNVVALTSDARCVLIRQFRFGTSAVTLEIPGGMVDPGESALEAARRELLEETGYASQQWVSLGAVAPNPAFQSNRLYTYLALDCALTGEQQLDQSEDIAVELVAESQLDALVARGEIEHALVVVALHKLALFRHGHTFPDS